MVNSSFNGSKTGPQYLSAGLTGIFLSASLPLANTKCERGVFVDEPVRAAIRTRSGSDSSEYGRDFWKRLFVSKTNSWDILKQIECVPSFSIWIERRANQRIDRKPKSSRIQSRGRYP